MQKRTTTVMVALVAAVLTAGVTPVQAQVDPDCDDDFDIPDSEPLTPESLPGQSSEVGQIMVPGPSEVTVIVEVTSQDLLKFGVFVQDGVCGTNPGSTCGDDEEVETDSILDPQSKECDLDPGETYFFHLVNDGGSSLEYKIWED